MEISSFINNTFKYDNSDLYDNITSPKAQEDDIFMKVAAQNSNVEEFGHDDNVLMEMIVSDSKNNITENVSTSEAVLVGTKPKTIRKVDDFSEEKQMFDRVFDAELKKILSQAIKSISKSL